MNPDRDARTLGRRDGPGASCCCCPLLLPFGPPLRLSDPLSAFRLWIHRRILLGLHRDLLSPESDWCLQAILWSPVSCPLSQLLSHPRVSLDRRALLVLWSQQHKGVEGHLQRCPLETERRAPLVPLVLCIPGLLLRHFPLYLPQ